MHAIRLPAGSVELEADLTIPPSARGIVLFAHGSGSSRNSPRNRMVADALQRAGYATMLMDLLTAAEEHLDQQTLQLRFDVRTLADRLTAAADWLAGQRDTAALPLVIFGASTGAAAALMTAADRADRGTPGHLARRAARPGRERAHPGARPDPADRRRGR